MRPRSRNARVRLRGSTPKLKNCFGIMYARPPPVKPRGDKGCALSDCRSSEMMKMTFGPPEGRLPLYSLQPAGLVMAVKSAAAERDMSQAAVVRASAIRAVVGMSTPFKAATLKCKQGDDL